MKAGDLTFEKGKTYCFIGKDVRDEDEITWLYLAYEGYDTLKGYEGEDWGFRVKVLDYQLSKANAAIGQKILCKVVGFNMDKGEVTTFPILTQDKAVLLNLNYKVGEIIDFKVLKTPGWIDRKGEEVSSYLMVDKLLHFHHRLRGVSASYAIGDIVKLRVEEIDAGGYLKLSVPQSQDETEQKLPEQDWNDLRIAGIDNLEPEGQCIEYKSSFVYDARTSKPHLDHQLGYVIMKTIAGFMNTDGGEVRIGYNDDRSPCGIVGDLEHINSGGNDEEEEERCDYKPSIDGLTRLFTDKIKTKLGRFAATLVRVEFFKKNIETNGEKEQLLFCHLSVKPSSRIIYYKNKSLFVRIQNQTEKLVGPDFADWVLEWDRRRENYNPIPKEILPIQTVDSRIEKATDEDVGVIVNNR